jgi:hypothetical protein
VGARHAVPFGNLKCVKSHSIRFSDSLHQFFAATLSFFQIDRIKRAALSSTVYGVFFSAHHSATDFRNNFL